MLPDHYCEECIRYYMSHEKLKELVSMKVSDDLCTCDHCGEDRVLYEIPYTIGDWLDFNIKIHVRCVACGKRLKIVSSEEITDPRELEIGIDGMVLIVQSHDCKEAQR